MKIGILTFHCAHNYGAVLQCYALQYVLESLGHHVEIIDYCPKSITDVYKVFDWQSVIKKNPLSTIKRLFLLILSYNRKLKRNKQFERFSRLHLHLSKWSGSTPCDIPSGYDAYVIGSDQVWNEVYTHGYDDAYFANFSFPKGNRVYLSYAVSMGKGMLTSKEEEDYIRNALSHFDAISVRETSLLSLLQPLTKKEIKVVTDPTLLVGSDVWGAIGVKFQRKRKVVLVYQVVHGRRVKSVANYIAKLIGAEVVVMYPKAPPVYKRYPASSPEEFVGAFLTADFVVTTSFHGTAFSIICQKPFYTVRLHSDMDIRSTALLNSLGLSDRMIDGVDMPNVTPIDYSMVKDKLELMRESSKEFLAKALQG